MMMEAMIMGLGASEQGQGWRKGPWTPEEDKLLTAYVDLHGEGRWSSVAKCSGLNRSSKSCRLRWVNYLRPGLKRGRITPQEEGIIIELHALWGNKWSTIARYLPGRTDNEIKNYWRTHFKKKAKPTGKLQETMKGKNPQQQQQEDFIRGGTTTKASPQSSQVKNDYYQHVSDDQPQTKQEMLFRYPSMEFMPVMYQDAASSSVCWPDTILLDGLWGGLWSLDDHHHQPFSRVEQFQPSECGKIAVVHTQPTTTTSCSSHGDTLNNMFNNGGEYVF